MKAALISIGSTSSRWTTEEMKHLFEAVDPLDLRKIEINFGSKDVLLYQGKPLPTYDCVYVKGSFHYGILLNLISELLWGKSYLPLKPGAGLVARNKALTHLELQKANIPMPKTYLSPTITAARSILKEMSYPIVMKFLEGTHGKGVMFAESYPSASSLLDALGALDQPFLIQEYIDTGGEDIRAFVVGDTVVAAMKRKAKADEKRANIHAGGEGSLYEPDRKIKKIAVDAAKAIGAGICGVDVLEGARGPLVLEVNVSPGLQGITRVTGINVAQKIARFLKQETQAFLEKKGITAAEILKEAGKKPVGKELITNLSFKGDRIVLPEVVTKVTGFNERDNYTLTAEKGKLVIEEFKV